jgi:MFS family permease
MPADRVVAVSGRLILVSGLGSVLGPLMGASLMAHFNIDGVFYFMAAAALLLAFLAAGRSLTAAAQAAPLAHDSIGSSDEPRSPDPVGVASEEG